MAALTRRVGDMCDVRHGSEGVMGDLGVPELLIILAIVVVIFGPGKLADLGRALGSGLRDFRHAIHADAPLTPASSAAHDQADAPMEADAADQR